MRGLATRSMQRREAHVSEFLLGSNCYSEDSYCFHSRRPVLPGETTNRTGGGPGDTGNDGEKRSVGSG